MSRLRLKQLIGTTLRGTAELWLDPLGNEAIESECTITVLDGVVSYTWWHEGRAHEGQLTLSAHGARWSDSWHQPEPMSCDHVKGSQALLDVAGTYEAGKGPPWGWRTSLSERPSGELVLQMTNIAPWGERGRAVRMVAGS